LYIGFSRVFPDFFGVVFGTTVAILQQTVFFGGVVMTFADKLQELRDRAGLTQAALAEKSSVPLWTVRNYEQGRREPNWKGVIQLASALGVPVEVFADCTSNVERPPPKAKRAKRKEK
jgi:transcriptional regulator with XRE-family HTH domain